MADRAPIWGDVDLKAFCRKTGYSREHATRELSRIRNEEGAEFAFETKQRCTGRRRRKRWGVMVSRPGKLRFDQHSLFYDKDGDYLHTYTTLGAGKVKIAAAIPLQSGSSEEPRKVHDPGVKPAKDCDNSTKSEGGSATQQTNSCGARRRFNSRASTYGSRTGADNIQQLRRKAFVLLASLEQLHWDNCKVLFNRRTAFSFLFLALQDGHEVTRILGAYEKALVQCHAFACDRAASRGEVCFFNLSSTVSKARKELARDGLNRSERVKKWYQRRKEQQQPAPAPAENKAVNAMTAEELHRAMAQSMGLSP